VDTHKTWKPWTRQESGHPLKDVDERCGHPQFMISDCYRLGSVEAGMILDFKGVSGQKVEYSGKSQEGDKEWAPECREFRSTGIWRWGK